MNKSITRYNHTLTSEPYVGTEYSTKEYSTMECDNDGEYIKYEDYIKNIAKSLTLYEFEYALYKVCNGDIRELYDWLVTFEYLLVGGSDDDL